MEDFFQRIDIRIDEEPSDRILSRSLAHPAPQLHGQIEPLQVPVDQCVGEQDPQGVVVRR